MRYGGFTAALLFLAVQAMAEPYIAVRTGLKCSQCHVNGTGGGKRTDYGYVYSQYKLLMKSAMNDTRQYSFDPKLNESVSLGANFRIEQTYTREYTTKPANPGEVPKLAPGVWDAGTFKEKNLYVEMDLVKDWLKLYYDKDMGGGAPRELWGKVSLPGKVYAKAGQMLLPYGFRLMDDEAFVRKTTGYTYGTTGLGYELGFEPGPFSFVANATQNTLTSVGSIILTDMPVIRTVRVGGSHSLELRKQVRRKKGSYGAFGGASFGMFTLLGQRDYTMDDSIRKVEDYFEVDFLPARGFNVKAVYESLWPDRDIPFAQNRQQRIILGLEPFLTQFLQLGLYYRLNEWIPQNVEKNQDQIVGRIHVFF